MDNAPLPGDSALANGFEKDAGAQRRLAHDADAVGPALAERRRQRTLRALADVDQGHVIDDEAMQAWADSLGTDQELPPPPQG